MTDNKRFMIDDSGELIDLNIPKFVDWGDDVCELLNQLANENEELNNEIYDWKTSAEDYKKLGQSLLKENGELKQRVNLISDEITAQGIVIEGYQDRNKKLFEENEQLKSQLYDCKKDEKQLSISFMEFKMQLIEVLQQNYNYAYNQRQRNLDNSIIARTYEVLYQTIYNIAETMNVDIERFPKSDDVE